MKKTLALLALCALPSCASIVEGSKQTLIIDTQPECAHCRFEQDGRQVAEVRCTSGTIEVDRVKHDIKASCSKAGYGVSTQYLDSGFEEWALGNLAFGGIIGAGIDWATGALHQYPERTQITLLPKVANTPAPARAPEHVVREVFPAAPFQTGESAYVAIPQHSTSAAPIPAAVAEAPTEPVIAEGAATANNIIWAQ
jgi:hypothetical protein